MQRLTSAAGLAGLTLAIAVGSQDLGIGSGSATTADQTILEKTWADMQPKPGDGPSTVAFKEAGMRMMRDMALPYTGDPDADFWRQMIPHHQGAIDMAQVALRYAKSPEARRKAQAIIDLQGGEIAEMQARLTARSR